MAERAMLAASETRPATCRDDDNTYVTFALSDQLFGVPVLKVQDILVPEDIAPIPLAPPAVRGAINLRGRIVTVIDVRVRLRLPPRTDGQGKLGMGVTVEHGSDLYTLLVDRIGDVIALPVDRREDNPSTLDPVWREIAEGVFRLDDGIMVILNVDRLLDLSR